MNLSLSNVHIDVYPKNHDTSIVCPKGIVSTTHNINSMEKDDGCRGRGRVSIEKVEDHYRGKYGGQGRGEKVQKMTMTVKESFPSFEDVCVGDF